MLGWNRKRSFWPKSPTPWMRMHVPRRHNLKQKNLQHSNHG